MQFLPQGPKLVGTGATGPASDQGLSIALSGDGNTAILGSPADNYGVGAAWVFFRNAGVWAQQSKLVGTGAVGPAQQGISVALSADGSTAIVGGNADNHSVGAVWVFTRFSGTWTQQGPKLVGTDAVGAAGQGTSVALSAGAGTIVVGGSEDNGGVGAAWVFVRGGSGWIQQGPKLVGTVTGVYPQKQGCVALSADGTTAIVGGPADNGGAGAAWVFTRSGDTWTQGSKLFATDAVGAAGQGTSVALSIDGNTAIVGGPTDGSGGAAWVYVRQ